MSKGNVTSWYMRENDEAAFPFSNRVGGCEKEGINTQVRMSGTGIGDVSQLSIEINDTHREKSIDSDVYDLATAFPDRSTLTPINYQFSSVFIYGNVI